PPVILVWLLSYSCVSKQGKAEPTSLRASCYVLRCATGPTAPGRASVRSALPAPARLGWPRRSGRQQRDRKSTRLNSSHVSISYAVFCLKKKKKKKTTI